MIVRGIWEYRNLIAPLFRILTDNDLRSAVRAVYGSMAGWCTPGRRKDGRGWVGGGRWWTAGCWSCERRGAGEKGKEGARAWAEGVGVRGRGRGRGPGMWARAWGVGMGVGAQNYCSIQN